MSIKFAGQYFRVRMKPPFEIVWGSVKLKLAIMKSKFYLSVTKTNAQKASDHFKIVLLAGSDEGLAVVSKPFSGLFLFVLFIPSFDF